MTFQKNAQQYILIDDDVLSNRISTFIIKSVDKGSQVTDFTDGLMALEYIRSNNDKMMGCPPTIVLLDINMPKLNGWDFLEKFGMLSDTVKSKFKIFVSSASLDAKDKAQAESNTIVSWYFVKPLTQNMIYGILTELSSFTIIPALNQTADFAEANSALEHPKLVL
ncbi:MAG: response regulator [Bacteroidota bacterium]